MDANNPNYQKVQQFVHEHIDEGVEIIIKVTRESLPGQYRGNVKDKLLKYILQLVDDYK